MKYQLKAYSIYELGARKNQEDSIYPGYGQTLDSDRLFILCDGMGGHDAGEVASSTVCGAMSASVLSGPGEAGDRFTDDDFAEALAAAMTSLDEKDTGAEKKMGTTMTFLKLHEDGATIAHIGDSRVYHIRPGSTAEDTEILFETEDHSLVNELIKIGELTPEEAKHSRQKNVITRAMQPNMERKPKADLHHTSDIVAGDYFFMCSDGMLEEMEDKNIRFIFSDEGGDDLEKIRILTEVTKDNKDNHSAFVIHILDVCEGPVSESGAVEKVSEEPSAMPIPEKTSDRKKVWKSRKEKVPGWHIMFWSIVVLGLAVILLGTLLWMKKSG